MDISKLQAIRGIVDELILEAGPIDLPPATGTRVTTALEFMRAGERGGKIIVAPGTYAVNLELHNPTRILEEKPGTVLLKPEDGFRAALSVQSDDVAVLGGTVTNARDDRETVVVGKPDERDAGAQPTNVLFENLVLEALEGIGGKRGFALHSRAIVLRNCIARNFWFKGFDSQALYFNNGPGPLTVEGGYYEASGENILLGGASMPCGINPSARFSRVTMKKPQAWRGQGYQIKNLLEIKSGVGIIVEDCELDGNWGPIQGGNAIVLTPRNQYNDSPGVQVDEVLIIRNVVRNCPEGFAVNVLGMDDTNPSESMVSLAIEENLFVDSPNGVQIGNAPDLGVEIRRNTFAGIRGRFLSFHGPAIARLEFTGNVTRSGEYGIVSDDQVTVGLPALRMSARNITWEGNVIELTNEREITYPNMNLLVPPGALTLEGDQYLYLGGARGWPGRS